MKIILLLAALSACTTTPDRPIEIRAEGPPVWQAYVVYRADIWNRAYVGAGCEKAFHVGNGVVFDQSMGQDAVMPEMARMLGEDAPVLTVDDMNRESIVSPVSCE